MGHPPDRESPADRQAERSASFTIGGDAETAGRSRRLEYARDEGDTMEEVRRDDCPHCGEPIAFEVDPEETAGRRIVDCDVCCRPIEVRFRVRGGIVQAVSVVAI